MRPDDYGRAYLDSCVWIRSLVRGSSEQVFVESIMQVGTAVRLMISPLIIVEAHGQHPGPEWDPAVEAEIEFVLENRNVLQVEFDHETAWKARALMKDERLKLADAIHLASAILAGADVFLTCDREDFRVGRQVQGVWIDEPYLPNRVGNLSHPLFDV